MKTAFILIILTFSLSAVGESISLLKAVESLTRGDITTVKQYLESEDINKACLKRVLAQIKKNHWEFDTCLTKKEKGLLLILAIQSTEKSVVVSLINNTEIDMDSRDEYGYSPLHWASKKGHTETVLALINNGANVNSEDQYGKAPLHRASENGHTETTLALINKGANVNSEDQYGKTPLHRASENGHTETALALINNEANVNSKGQGYFNQTPLYLASENGHTETILVLINNGADPNIQDNFYEHAPLHWVIANGLTKEVVLVLIEKGANINVQNAAGTSPLHVATDYRNTDLVRILINNGADIEIEDREGQTAFDLAMSRSPEIALILAKNTESFLTRKWRLWKIED